jgi:prepilin-type N-terminal cleavage/methylation domain-containing protein
MKTHNPSCQSLRKGFTLVELVVVVLVLGIIAATAAPKMFNTAGDARESSTSTSLAVVRDAIDLYHAQVGTYPGDAGTEADFKTDIESFLRGPFPTNQLPAAANDTTVRVQTTGTALTANGAQDWAYDSTTGEFIINTSGFDTL